jgi:ATP-dependent Zn protease
VNRVKLAATAYHEAGHAVMMLHLGVRFRTVTIVPEEDSLGHVLKHKVRNFRPDIEMNARTLFSIDQQIMCSLAGPAAEARFAGRYNRRGAKWDHDNAAKLVDYLAGEGAGEYALYLRLYKLRAKNMVNSLHFWKQVQSVAQSLLNRQTMTGEEVRELLYGPLFIPMSARRK